MSRSLKPYKVDQVTSPNGYSHADVMFDRNAKVFFVEIVPGDKDSRVTSDLLEDVKRVARSALERAQSYAWVPLILVNVSEPWFHHNKGVQGGVKLEIRRFERARNPSHEDQYVERAHPLDAPPMPGPRLERRELHRDIERYSGPDVEIGPQLADANGDTEVLLPYEQATWDGLCAIKLALDDAHARLRSLLRSKDVGRLLGSAAWPTALMLEARPVKKKGRT